jgi:beta-glucosidase
VLLKNDKQLLPLSKEIRTLALIGPLIKATMDHHGSWSVFLPTVDYSKLIVTQWDGIKGKLTPQTQLLYAKGCDIEGDSKEGFAEALEAAQKADVVVISVGEQGAMSGEAKSRSNIHMPGVQEELVQAVQSTGKPVVVLISAGRPLVFGWTAGHAPAIVYTWWLGSQTGNAIADVLFGDYNPSGKLPITFPRSEGQIPIYYNHFNTGRPPRSDTANQYMSAYIDLANSPRYPFGHGLSYTSFRYSDLVLDKKRMSSGEKIAVSLNVTNAGTCAGEEVVQLYLRDPVASLVRPVQELKDFQKIALQAGETKKVRFIIDKDKLSFFNQDLRWVAEPGQFDIMIGSSSADIRLRDSIELLGNIP